MTLKENFKQWFINDEEDEHYEGMVELVSIEHEKLADDFAIGFAQWFHENCYEDNVGYYRAEELLQIYKKEKGL